MMQFCVIGYDGTDPHALDRRNAARPAHRASALQLEAQGHLICGGGVLGEDGESVGSVMMMNFESREELDAWLEREPFVTQGVWERVEVKPMRITIAQSLPNK